MKMKSTYLLALLVATGALLLTSASLRASETDDRIESSAKKSYVFKTTSRTIRSRLNPRTASSP